MCKIKVSELTGAALDWSVCIAEGFKPKQLYINKYQHSPASIYTVTFDDDGNPDGYMTGPNRLYSKMWEAGGPIIERAGINLFERKGVLAKEGKAWLAYDNEHPETTGPTPLIAAMRCYVVSKLGDIVEIPKDLHHG